jgi:sigma-E factor negative regulatory protein RseC
MRETGYVRAVREGKAEVVVSPTAAEACASCGICEVGPMGTVLEVESVEGLEAGDRVDLEVSEPGSLGPAAVVFLVPVAALVAGAVLGARVPGWISGEGGTSTGAAVIGAFVMLGAAILAVRAYDRALNRRLAKPRIVRIRR